MRIFGYKGPGISISHFWDNANTPNKRQMHTHTFLELYVFLGGKASFHVDGTIYSLVSGDILLFRPNEGHKIVVDPEIPYDRVVINFDANLFSAIDPEKQLTRPFFDRKLATLNLYHKDIFPAQQFDTLLNGMLESSKGNRTVILANLILFLTQISEAFVNHTPNTNDTTIEQRILQYINKNLHRDLDILSICEKFHISKATLFRLCKNATGISVSKYIRMKRLLLCHMLIEEGEKPTRIFATYGFQDYSSFYRAYVKQFGYSPHAKGFLAIESTHAVNDD